MTTHVSTPANDTPIEFHNDCLWQANAVELTNGVIVFDSCGRCNSCTKHGLKDGVATKEQQLIGKVFRMATEEEISRKDTAIATWTQWRPPALRRRTRRR